MNTIALRPLQKLIQRSVFGVLALSFTLLALPVRAQKVYVTNAGSSTVSVINPANGALCTPSTCVSAATYPIPVGSQPTEAAVTPDGSKVYVTNAGSGSVSVISTATDSVIDTISLGGGPDTYGLKITILPNGSAAYVVGLYSETVSVIDISNNTVTATISLSTIANGGIAATLDSSTVYLTVGGQFCMDGTPYPNSDLIAIDTSTNETTSNEITNLCNSSATLYAVSPDGTKAYAASTDGLETIDTASGAILSTVTVPNDGGNNGVPITGGTLSPDGSVFYASGTGGASGTAGSVYAISGNSITTTATVGINPEGVSLATNGDVLFVANNSSGTVSELLVPTLALINTVTVGTQPTSIGVLPPVPMSGEDLGPNQCQCDAADPSMTVTSLGRASAGEPIDIGSGNMSYQVTDYTTADQNPLAFTRYYNSRAGTSGLGTFAYELGPNWRSNFDHYLQLTSSTEVIAERGTGQQFVFTLSGSTWTPNSDVDLTLTQSGSTWTLTDHDDTVETYTTSGAGNEALLKSITARDGYTQTLSYNESGQLATVTDSYGRTLSFTYSGVLLDYFTTPEGNKFYFIYNSNNTLS